MPVNIRPPPGSSLLHYPEAFDPEMEFQLRERNLATLEEMENNAVDVEANLLIKREKLEGRRDEEHRSIGIDIFRGKARHFDKCNGRDDAKDRHKE